MRSLAFAVLLAGPAMAQDAPGAGTPCPALLVTERARCSLELEHLAAELRVAEAALRQVPEPPSRLTWMLAGAGIGLALGASLTIGLDQ